MPFSIDSALPLLLLLAKATAVLGIAVVASLLLQRRSASLRHVVWLTALTGVLVLPLLATRSPVSLRVIPSSFASEWATPWPWPWPRPIPFPWESDR